MNHLPPPASAHVDILTRAEHGRHTFVFVFFPPQPLLMSRGKFSLHFLSIVWREGGCKGGNSEFGNDALIEGETPPPNRRTICHLEECNKKKKGVFVEQHRNQHCYWHNQCHDWDCSVPVKSVVSLWRSYVRSHKHVQVRVYYALLF